MLQKFVQFVKSFQIDPITWPDELAEELGARPSYWRLFWKNPFLAHKVHYGPNLGIVYRLLGPAALKSPVKVNRPMNARRELSACQEGWKSAKNEIRLQLPSPVEFFSTTGTFKADEYV